MAIPERQILVCQSFRSKGDPKGICHKQTDGFLQYLEEEILDRGLDVQAAVEDLLLEILEEPVGLLVADALGVAFAAETLTDKDLSFGDSHVLLLLCVE